MEENVLINNINIALFLLPWRNIKFYILYYGRKDPWRQTCLEPMRVIPRLCPKGFVSSDRARGSRSWLHIWPRSLHAVLRDLELIGREGASGTGDLQAPPVIWICGQD